MIDWKYGVLRTYTEVRDAEGQLERVMQRLEQARRLHNDAINAALFELGSTLQSDADGIIPLDERTFLLVVRRGMQTDAHVKEVLE